MASLFRKSSDCVRLLLSDTFNDLHTVWCQSKGVYYMTYGRNQDNMDPRVKPKTREDNIIVPDTVEGMPDGDDEYNM